MRSQRWERQEDAQGTDTQQDGERGFTGEPQPRLEKPGGWWWGLASCLPGPSKPPHLVAEDLDLADCAVHQALGARATVVGVDLQVQGDTLDPLLRGEVCAQAVDANENLGTEWGAGSVACTGLQPCRWRLLSAPMGNCRSEGREVDVGSADRLRPGPSPLDGVSARPPRAAHIKGPLGTESKNLTFLQLRDTAFLLAQGHSG